MTFILTIVFPHLIFVLMIRYLTNIQVWLICQCVGFNNSINRTETTDN